MHKALCSFAQMFPETGLLTASVAQKTLFDDLLSLLSPFYFTVRMFDAAEFTGCGRVLPAVYTLLQDTEEPCATKECDELRVLLREKLAEDFVSCAAVDESYLGMASYLDIRYRSLLFFGTTGDSEDQQKKSVMQRLRKEMVEAYELLGLSGGDLETRAYGTRPYYGGALKPKDASEHGD